MVFAEIKGRNAGRSLLQRLEPVPRRTLERQHGSDLILCDLFDVRVAQDGIDGPSHVPQRHGRMTEGDDDVAFTRERKVVFDVEILRELPGPAVSSLAGVLAQGLRSEVKQRLNERLTQVLISDCGRNLGRSAGRCWRR